MFRDAGLVAVGGAAGSLLRWWVSLALPIGPGWSWATFTVNASGAFLLGLLLEALTRPGPERRGARAVRMLLGTGLLGGFTTYSTFVLELWARVRSEVGPVAFGDAVLMLIAGLAAAAIGIAVGAWLRGPRRSTPASGETL